MSASILSVGFDFSSFNVESVDFDSPRSLFEFDVVVVSWDKYIDGLRKIASENHGALRASDWSSKSKSLQLRNKSIIEFVDHGKVVIVLAKQIKNDLKYSSGGNYYSADLRKIIPPQLIDCDQMHGYLVETPDSIPSPVRKFANAITDYIEYFAVLPTANNGIPIMKVVGTQKTTALWHPGINGGGLLFCPLPRATRAAYEVFQHALEELSRDLEEKPRDEIDPLPDWHNQYRLPEEVAVSTYLADMEKSLEELAQKIHETKERLEEIIFLKRLISDKGDSLLSAAGKAFEILGFSVSPGPIGRDDLILIDKFNKNFVVEVKGKDSRGAAESDAAQLEKWVSGFHHEHNVEPKGVLVINGYRTMPLVDRKEAVFPDQMLQYVRRKEHCLVSGYQLLSLVLAFQQGKVSQEDVQRQIYESVGVLPILTNVSDCLSLLHSD